MGNKKEEPYRFKKRLQKIGNSVGVIIPSVWFEFRENKKAEEVIVKVYSDKIVLVPIINKRK